MNSGILQRVRKAAATGRRRDTENGVMPDSSGEPRCVRAASCRGDRRRVTGIATVQDMKSVK